jgi:hypothetical protein
MLHAEISMPAASASMNAQQWLLFFYKYLAPACISRLYLPNREKKD